MKRVVQPLLSYAMVISLGMMTSCSLLDLLNKGEEEVDDPQVVEKNEVDKLKTLVDTTTNETNDDQPEQGWLYPIPEKLMKVTGKTLLDDLALSNSFAVSMLTEGKERFAQGTSDNHRFYRKLYAFENYRISIRAYYHGGHCDLRYESSEILFQEKEKGLQYIGEEIALPMTPARPCQKFVETQLFFPADEFRNMFLTAPQADIIQLRMDVGGYGIAGIMTIDFKKTNTTHLQLTAAGQFNPPQ